MWRSIARATIMMIDIHTHILPERWPSFVKQFGYEGFVDIEHSHPGCAKLLQNGKVFREIQANCWDPATRLQECASQGVDVQVLSTVPAMFSYWAQAKHAMEISKFLNDHLAEVVAAHRTRFIGLGTVPMQNPDFAIKELERCIGELGLKGVEIGSHINLWNLDDKHLYPFYEAAQDLGAALLVHPWEMVGQEKMPKYWLPWLVGMPAETTLAISSMIFGGIFEQFPRLRVAFAHGGGAFPFTLGRIDRGFETRPDLCATMIQRPPSDYIKSFYVDSLVHSTRSLKFLVELMGADRIMLGTDYPFPLGESEPGKLIRNGGFSNQETQYMLCDTALNWLDMKKEAFV